MGLDTRGDRLARRDLGTDIAKLACSICGRRGRGVPVWISILKPHELRCRACWMPSGEEIRVVQVRRTNGKVVMSPVLCLR